MILTFVRSSSQSTHKLCEFQWWLNYNLGFDPGSNKAAARGTIVHKALEILARAKKARQDSLGVFYDRELLGGREVSVDVSDDDAMGLAWKHYTEGAENHHNWLLADESECSRLFRIVLNHAGGVYNPRNLKIVQPEQYFDITLDYPWAAYDYELPNGERLKGQLCLKGTMDLITEEADKSLHYIDWKTGRMIDWATGRPKTIDDLYNDFQLRLYHLALHHLYPDHDSIGMTIYYVKHGPYSLAFHKDEVPDTIQRIRKWFEMIKNTDTPQRRIGPPCTTFCKHGTTKWKDQRYIDAGTDPHGNHLSVCDHVHAEVQQLGVSKVMAKYADVSKLTRYGSGGGSDNRE